MTIKRPRARERGGGGVRWGLGSFRVVSRMAIQATFPLVTMSVFVGGMVGLAGRELGKWRCGVDDVWERGGAPK